MNINLHIERLVLDGFAYTAGEGEALGAALQAELVRILTQDGLGQVTGSAQFPRVDGGAVSAATGVPVRQFGQQLAQPLLGALRK